MNTTTMTAEGPPRISVTTTIPKSEPSISSVVTTQAATAVPSPVNARRPPGLDAAAVKRQSITAAGGRLCKSLDPDDRQYLDKRERIISKYVKGSHDAARALHEIHTYRDGVLWRRDHDSFASYMKQQWNFEKSQGYRLLKFGIFIAALETPISPFGENLPTSEGQVRELIDLVPEHYQVECWNEITSEKAANELTGGVVSALVKEFLNTKGLTSGVSKPAEADARKCVMRDIAKLRASLAKLDEPERFDDLLQQISDLVDEDRWDNAVEVEAMEVLDEDRSLRYSPPPAGRDRCHPEQNGCWSTTMDQVPMRAGSGLTAEGVAMAMDSVGPSTERGIVIATANLIPEGSAGRHDQRVSEKIDGIAPEEQTRAADSTIFLAAKVFHKAIESSEPYPDWLASLATSHPADIRDPNDSEGASISSIRAKQLAYLSTGDSANELFRTLTEGCMSDKINRSEAMNTLLSMHVQRAEQESKSRLLQQTGSEKQETDVAGAPSETAPRKDAHYAQSNTIGKDAAIA